MNIVDSLTKPYIIGVDLGGTNVRAAVTDRNGTILGDGREPSMALSGVDVTIGQIILAIKSALASAKVDISQVAGIGMGVPGQHNSKEGIVLWSPNFSEDWNGVQLLAPIKEELGLPAFMGNDVNIAALGEFTFGAAKGSRSMAMFTIGTGVGGGIIIDGKLLIGANEMGGEMGHTIILPDGPKCSCGRHGCMESLCGRNAIIERAARKIQMGRKSVLIENSDWPQWSVTPADISKAAEEGDEVAIETLAETAYYIGIGVTNAINTLNPEVVIVGGGIAQAGDALWGPLLRTVDALALTGSKEIVRVVPADLGDDAGILGGVSLVLHEGGN